MKIKYVLLLFNLYPCVQNTKEKSTKFKDANLTSELNKKATYSDTIAIDFLKLKDYRDIRSCFKVSL